MHETKVNTKSVDVISAGSKNVLDQQYIGRIGTPYGAQYIDRGAALDHAHMRSRQLSSLLLLMGRERLDDFRSINGSAQDRLLWLARQLATETEAMFDIVVADQAGGQQ